MLKLFIQGNKGLRTKGSVKNKMETVKGFNDFTGKDALKRAKMKRKIVETFEKYGFEPAETPVVEYEEFVRGENSNDEAVRDVFRLEDRGKRKLALRYEWTFQLKRISQNKKFPYKRYQVGELFRDEPIRAGRSRQFIQCDVDVVGSSIKDEAEILTIAKEVFGGLGIKIKILVNNRKLMNEILEKEKVGVNDRAQVIREIDKLDKLSEVEVKSNLARYGASDLIELFRQKEKNFEVYENYSEIDELKSLCAMMGVSVEFSPTLARGLSYYNGNVFEIWSEELGVSLAGGGGFLVNGIQSTGLSFGLEPIFLLSKVEADEIDYAIISLGQDGRAIEIAEKLRAKEKKVSLIFDKSPSKALEWANAYGVKKVVFVGEKEVNENLFKVKDMKTGVESELSGI